MTIDIEQTNTSVRVLWETVRDTVIHCIQSIQISIIHSVGYTVLGWFSYSDSDSELEFESNSNLEFSVSPVIVT